jgi:hypothetical protein
MLAVGAALTVAPTRVRADLFFDASGIHAETGNRISAQAIFTLLPDDVLQIVLTNTSPDPEAIRRGDILTGIVWDIAGENPRLSGLTVSRGTSDLYVARNTIDNQIPLNGRWTFRGASSGPYAYANDSASFEYGVSAIGGGVFGGVRGDDYGLVADAASLDNPSFTRSAFPLLVGSATFGLSGFTADLASITNVRFTFGAGPSHVLAAGRGVQGAAVPEPSAVVLVAAGLATIGGIALCRRRRLAPD